MTKKLSSLLLDSSLISATNESHYDYKVIYCNNYVQIYKFEHKKIKKENSFEKIDDIKKINTDNLRKMHTVLNTADEKLNHHLVSSVNERCVDLKHKIDLKNVMRSKLECQRLAKCNADFWKTFITLTFADNVIDIKFANKKFKYFVDKIRRIFKDFKYICIPEFQKRGAVHYHLLTNISISDTRFIYEQDDNSYFKHIKYWNDGFTKVDNIDKDIKKIVGYISKYMTKDIDNRLFNHHRYLFSKNLIKPSTSFINSNNINHVNFLCSLLENRNLIYENTYYDLYYNGLIHFEEYLLKDDIS